MIPFTELANDLAIGIGLMLCGIAYFIASINAHASQEDDVVSIPGPGADSGERSRAISAAAGQAATTGNAVIVYQNGYEIFPPMLESIRSSHSSVHFETYVYEGGVIPGEFAAAFAEAAKRGVQVRIILDRDGAIRTPKSLLTLMRDAGCDVQWFRSARWYDWGEYNRRTHRRLLVVDGRVGFTGGVGIADEWSGAGDSPEHWRDTHVRIMGPAVAAMQRAFVDSWNDTTGELVLGSSYFPALADAGDTTVCVVQSNPANGTSAAQRTIAALVAIAERSLWITNAYFVPTPSFIDALCRARARGVDVRVLVPGPFHNKPFVRRASRHTWSPLLKGGVRLFEHQRTMVHAKVITVDDAILCVGSINFDPRSFALNAECAAVVFGASQAQEQAEQFRRDLTACREVVMPDLSLLTALSRTVDRVAYWFRAEL